MTAPARLPVVSRPALTTDVGAKAKEILHGPAYRFCQEPRFPWTDAEAEWCSTVGDRNDRCEAVVRACRGEMTHAPGSRRGHRGPGETQDESQPLVLHLPRIGGLGTALFWTMVAIVVVFIVREIAKRGFGSRGSEPTTEDERAKDGAHVATQRSAVEIDVQRLLARARRAASEGRFADGIADAYAALLRQLEGERLVRIDPWRTNGDYLRDLGPRPEIRAAVGGVVRNVERVQFGREAPTLERFESVLAQVTDQLAASSARSARALGAAATTVMLMLVLSLASCKGVPRGPEEDSPSGTSAVMELLRRTGFEPRMRLRSLEQIGDANQLVLLPGANVDDDDWGRIVRWANEGGTLVVGNRDRRLAKWSAVSFGARPHLPAKLSLSGSAKDELPSLEVVVPDGNELVLAKNPEPKEVLLEREGSIYAARFEYGKGRLIALADGYLLGNASLAMADDAAFLIGALEPGGKRIDMVGELTGSGAKSPVASIRRGKLAPLLLQLGFFLVLLFAYKGVAFGTLRDPPSQKRRSFAEHARAVGLLYAKARAASHARALYSAYALERLRDSMLLREQRGIATLAEVVAARSGQPLGKVAMLLVEAQDSRPDETNDKGSHEDLDLVRRLSRLLRLSKGASH